MSFIIYNEGARRAESLLIMTHGMRAYSALACSGHSGIGVANEQIHNMARSYVMGHRRVAIREMRVAGFLPLWGPFSLDNCSGSRKVG